MFLNQPGAVEFGDRLVQELEDARWTSFDLAVAWVRKSGTDRLNASVKSFLSRGGRIRATVGIDLLSTSLEGLQALIDWQDEGNAEIFVYHDENPSITFHPKVYLFGDGDILRLFVGSNNLTGSGLADNTEASLMIEGSILDPAIAEATSALRQWRDDSLDLVRRLDSDFLAELVESDYVRSERELQRKRSESMKRGEEGGHTIRNLFGRTSVRRSRATRTSLETEAAERLTTQQTSTAIGQSLLMRIRPARGGTQVQLPKRLRESPFFQPAGTLVSAHSGHMHPISPARARGIVNTLKLEIPEAAGMTEPLLRLRWQAGSLQYEVFESTSPEGSGIKITLENGLATNPPQTFVSKANLDVAQWWRFV